MCSIWVSIDKSNGKVNCFLAISLKTLVAHQNNLYVKNNVNVIGEVCLSDGDFWVPYGMFKCALLTEENTVAMTYTVKWEVSKIIFLKIIHCLPTTCTCTKQTQLANTTSKLN